MLSSQRFPACLLAILVLGSASARSDDTGVSLPAVPGEVLVRMVPGRLPGQLPGLDALPVRSTEPLFPGARTGQALDRWFRFRLSARGVPGEVATRLAEIRGVERAEPNLLFTLDAVPDDTYAGGPGGWSEGAWRQPYPDLWGMSNIGADRAWDLETGDPAVVIAVVDSGIDFDHEDLRDNVWRNPGEIAGNRLDDDRNGFVDDDTGWSFAYDERDVMDRFWHGTHMAGIIAAVGDNGRGVAGVMWRASLMPVKAFDDRGSGTLADIAAGIRYAADNGADVVNLSFSLRGEPSELLRDAVRYARRAGCAVVASAGNSNADIGDCNGGFFGGRAVSFPACFAGVISVGSVDHLDVKTDFSNWGAALDVTAPGGDSDDGSRDEQFKNILSTRASQAAVESALTIDGAYYRNRGTSMAAAHVSGLIGLVMSRQPGTSAELARSIVQAAAADLGDPGRDSVFGYGRIDAHEALNVADRSLSSPDLVAMDFWPSRGELAEGTRLPLALKLMNAGRVPAGPFTVELIDESPSGPRPLTSWSRLGLAPGRFTLLRTIVSLSGTGIHRLRVVVDAADAVGEINEANNELARSVGVWPYRFVERRVTSVPLAQEVPRVSGDRVVWMDYRNDPRAADIYAFDLATGVEQRVTDSPYFEEFPAVDGDVVVWQDLRQQSPPPGTWDIYRGDLTSGAEHRVTTVDDAELVPDVSGDWIVWMDSRNGLGNTDIYGYDLSAGSEVPLVTAPGNQEEPSISGDRIVFEDWRQGNGDIRLYEISTGMERPLVVEGSNQLSPRIDGDTVVFEDYRHGRSEIYMFDLTGEVERRLTSHPSTKYFPGVSQGRVIWQDDRNDGRWDIYLFDLATGTERRVTYHLGIQRRPSISGRTIVWADARHADPATGASFEIYAARIDDFPNVPTGLVATGGPREVVLGWDDVVDPEGDLLNYRVFRAVRPEGPYDFVGRSDVPSFTDSGLPPARTFYYRVTAVDRGRSNLDLRRGESGFSAEASATTDPAPSPSGRDPRQPRRSVERRQSLILQPGSN